MRIAFASVFLAGLVLGVVAMLIGVQRPTGLAALLFEKVAPTPSLRRLYLAVGAAFATVAGATGYLLAVAGWLGPGATAGIAMAAGLLGGAGIMAVISGWAIPAALREPEDDRYLLQGFPARVVTAITEGTDGRIAYVLDGVAHTSSARSLDATAIEEGTEVVIERLELGIAYVEPWLRVEQRL